MSSNKFTEDSYEQTLISLFKELVGFAYASLTLSGWSFQCHSASR